MKSEGEALENRIRERAYHMWEASGRPDGRDEEFWHRASEALADDGRPRRRQGNGQAARPAARRRRSSGASAA
jgi:hypothetical protein